MMVRITAVGVGLAMTLTLAGCGSGNNNDQGVSFSAIGVNAVDEMGACQADAFLLGQTITISEGLNGADSTRDIGTCLTVQNNMITQTVRTERVLLDFHIAGAQVQPPSTSYAAGFLLGPAVPDTDDPNDTSTLPPGLTALGNTTQINQVAMPVETREWISLNRDLLPDLPFRVTVTHHVAAVTSSGDAIMSNPLDFPVTVLEDSTIGGGGGTTDGGANLEEGALGSPGSSGGESGESGEDTDGVEEEEPSVDEVSL